MSTFDSISGALPSPRDDEPPNLRQDILDELGDHLECALRREQLTGGTGGAEERVVNRFGDPAAVALKLWRDALWEKIMSQRLMLGLCTVMTLVCCAALGVTAVWLNRQEVQMKEQSELFSKLLTNSEASTKQLSEQLKHAQDAAAKSQPFSEWNPVELKFVSGSADGPPVAGVKVTLQLHRSGETIPTMEKVTDEKGIARFERAKFGSAYAAYSIKLGENVAYSGGKHMSLLPGEPFQATIVCPSAKPNPRPVTIEIGWPEEVRAHNPLLTLGDTFTFGKTAENEWWQFEFPITSRSRPLQAVGVGLSTGGFMGQAPVTVAYPAVDSRGQVEMIAFDHIQSPLTPNRADADDLQLFGDYLLVDVKSRTAYTESLRWPGPEYRLWHATMLLDGTGPALSKVFKSPTRNVPGRGNLESRGFGFARHSSDDPSVLERVDRCRLAVAIDMRDWKYELTQDEPNVLKLTPSQASVDSMRTAISRIDSTLARLVKEADERQVEAEKQIALWEQNAPQRAAEERRKKPFSEWNPVEFRFVEETPDGAPIAGLDVSFSASGGKDKNDFPSVRTRTDQDGRLRFERVRYGNYMLAAEAAGRGEFHASVTVLPGEGLTRTFTYSRPIQPTPVKLKINWPQELAERSTAVVLWEGRFTRSLKDSKDDSTSRFSFNVPEWSAVLAGESGASIKLIGTGDHSLPPSRLGTALSRYLWFEDLKAQPGDAVSWPGPEWKIDQLQIATRFSKDASSKAARLLKQPEGRTLYGFGVRLDVTRWDQKWEAGTPPTVILTPDEAGRQPILSNQKNVDSVEKYLTELDLTPKSL